MWKPCVSFQNIPTLTIARAEHALVEKVILLLLQPCGPIYNRAVDFNPGASRLTEQWNE